MAAATIVAIPLLAACSSQATNAAASAHVPPGTKTLGWVANFSYDSQPGKTVTPIDLGAHKVHSPVTTGSEPTGLAVSGNRVLVTNQGDNTVSVLGASDPSVRSTIKVGIEPRAVAVGSGVGGTLLALVANFSAGTLTPVNLATLHPGPPVVVGPQPAAVAVAQNRAGGAGTALVANFSAGTLTPVNLATLHPGPPVLVGPEPEAVAVAPGGAGGAGTALVANFGNNTVTPVALDSMTPGTPISLPAPPTAVAVAPGGVTAWVTCGRSLVPISLASLSAGSPLALPGVGEAVAFAPGHRSGTSSTTAWVAEQTGWVVPVAVASGRVGPGIYVGGRPSALVITPGPT